MSFRPSDNRLASARKFMILAKNLDFNTISFDALSLIELTTLYVISSRLYYEHDEPILEDTKFDGLCKYLLDNFEEIQNSKVYYKHLFTKDALKAGTGFSLKCPEMHQILAEDILYLLYNG
jgi:hypothetical protein